MITDEIMYLDHNATTPCDPRVVEAMLPYFTDNFWNPSSSHALGRRSARAVGDARERAAKAIGVDQDDLIFTSGSTEAIQLALERLPLSAIQSSGVAVLPIEHRAVLNAAARLRHKGVPIRELPVTRGGIIEIEAINQPLVYVVQAANSETGVVQPLKQIYDQVKRVGGWLISDATQALWKLHPSDYLDCADGLIFSAHKAYGPKGIGLLVATSSFRKALKSAYSQEAQEGGIREGTSNVPGIVGFARTLEIVAQEGETWRRNSERSRDEFELLIEERSEGKITPNFKDLSRLPNTSSLWFNGVPGDLLVANLSSIALSYGSACSSGSFEPSSSLIASVLERKVARETLRASFGRQEKNKRIEEAVIAIVDCFFSL